MTVYTTPDRPHPDGGFLRAHFGTRDTGQAPYITVTGTHVSRRNATHDRHWIACGQLHPDIRKVFPELVPLIEAHLCDPLPMHYVENAKFWHDMANGKRERKTYDPEPRATFVRHCNPLDAEDRNRLEAMLDRDWADVAEGLRERETRLRERYNTLCEAIPTLVIELGAEEGDGPVR